MACCECLLYPACGARGREFESRRGRHQMWRRNSFSATFCLCMGNEFIQIFIVTNALLQSKHSPHSGGDDEYRFRYPFLPAYATSPSWVPVSGSGTMLLSIRTVLLNRKSRPFSPVDFQRDSMQYILITRNRRLPELTPQTDRP